MLILKKDKENQILKAIETLKKAGFIVDNGNMDINANYNSIFTLSSILPKLDESFCCRIHFVIPRSFFKKEEE